MNREIKLRAKETIHNSWIYSNGYYFDGVNYWFTLTSTEPNIDSALAWAKHYRVDPKTIGQWTGRTNKAGNFIFEGDIVKAFGKYVFKVIFLDGSFLLESKHQRRWLFDCVESLEIIGNIYQDSHLLENPQ